VPTDTHRPGWKTSEHLIVWALIALALVLAARGVAGSEILKTLAGPSVVGGIYAAGRALLKFSSSQAKGLVSMDIDATIDSFVKKFVASKIPSSVALQPECDAAIVAAEALAHKAIEVYAVKLLAKKAPQLAATLHAAFPAAGL
jgi:hypothetical protein